MRRADDLGVVLLRQRGKGHVAFEMGSMDRWELDSRSLSIGLIFGFLTALVLLVVLLWVYS